MAARWGTGEDTLTACNNMDFFPMDTLDETDVLTSGETLEALQSCLDPSILSIFEDTPIIETKGLDEESEATLLTALTEILDNVDDENLSPFDTVPDSDLLSGQKGREHSPLRRLLCLSRSPPEKDALCSARTLSTGKSLPRMPVDSVQRSDGEEEEDGSLTLSPVGHDSSPDRDVLDWEGLTLPLPVTFEPEGEDGVSVSLGDLVRHMHPYCMTICMENDEGEQMLPEGGILLEVVDKGENGEPILAIPDMDLPVSLSPQESSSENEQKVSDDAEDAASESSEHIVVDDDVTEAPVKAASPVVADSSSDVKDELIIRGQKEEIKMKSPSRRKKKKKCKEQLQPKPVEGRVLRSGTIRNTAHQLVKKPEKRSVKEEKKQKLPKVSPASTSSTAQSKKQSSCHTETQPEITSTTVSAERKVQAAPPVSPTQEAAVLNANQEQSQPSSPGTAMSPPKPEMAEQLAPAHKKLEDSSAAPPAVLPPMSSESPAAAPCPVTALATPPVGEAPPPVVAELKPKSLSLAEYRRLRQQKKPTPVENQDNSNSTKWPSLPELPKELPPIPCLPDPSPKDPRRPNLQGVTKEEKEVRPAWQPRGPCAPPTPEALLVPPAYMVASASKASATSVPKPEKTPEASTTRPPQTALAAPSLVKESTNQHTTAVKCVPQISTVSSKPGSDSASTKFGVQHQPESGEIQAVELSRTCLKTTTEPTKPTTAATVSHPSASKRITVVFPKVPEVTAATSSENTISPDRKSPKPAASFTGADGAHPADSKNLKTKPVVLETKEKAVKPQQTKSPTQELIEAFTSEIGIEAADLNSLLEQFEETQAKEDQIVPGVSGRAAAVRNSSVESAPENSAVERVRANDLSSTAALTPPATPPHQMWKPLAPVALLGKSKTEASKSSPSKVIQIEARPLPSAKSRSRPTPPTASVNPEVACMDHDYCLPNTGPGESGKRWNVKQQSFITIKPIKPITATTQTPPAALAFLAQSTTNPAVPAKTQESPLTESMDRRTEGMERSSVLETPDASPARQEMDVTKEEIPQRGPCGRSYRQHATSRSPSPRACSKERTGGRSRKRRSRRSPAPISSGSESDSHSSRSRSRSHSPSKKRYRACRSRSSSSSASCSSSRSSPSVSRSPPRRRRYSYSSSRSGSWSRSRSRSRTPEKRAQWGRDRRLHRPGYGPSANPCMEKTKKYKEKAIEERRVVYVGRIRGTMTQNELKERFSLFGEIEDCTLHFRDRGDNYGFVTYYSTKDAFTAIENGSKLRRADELPFDLCFGGRRQFCQTSYADLDSSREYDPLPSNGKFHALDFDTLLKQAQQNQKR